MTPCLKELVFLRNLPILLCLNFLGGEDWGGVVVLLGSGVLVFATCTPRLPSRPPNAHRRKKLWDGGGGGGGGGAGGRGGAQLGSSRGRKQGKTTQDRRPFAQCMAVDRRPVAKQKHCVTDLQPWCCRLAASVNSSSQRR